MTASVLDLLSRLTGSSSLATGLLVTIGLAVLLYLVEQFLRPPLPKGVAFIREPEGARGFSLRTRWAFHTKADAIFHDAWNQYLKRGKAVVVPGLGFKNELLLPPSAFQWVLAQPDDVVSVGQAFAEMDQVYYSLGSDRYVLDDWSGHLVKTELTPTLEHLAASIYDELSNAFDTYVGSTPGEWKEVDLLETMRMVTAQTASRFTVGLPLCRS